MKARKCKCCGQKAITKRCFIGSYKGKDKFEAWKLWYDKKSNIICNSCSENIPLMAERMKEFEYDGCQKAINKDPKKYTRFLRHQIWYYLDLGLLDITRFKKNESSILSV